MILVIKNGKVFATHTDDQEYVVDRYPQDCDIIKVADDIQLSYSTDDEGRPIGMPNDPREQGIPYIDLRKTGSLEQRITDLEMAIASILGGGL